MKTCAECGFAIPDGNDTVLTEFGWAHPACVMDGSDWRPKPWA